MKFSAADGRSQLRSGYALPTSRATIGDPPRPTPAERHLSFAESCSGNRGQLCRRSAKPFKRVHENARESTKWGRGRFVNSRAAASTGANGSEIARLQPRGNRGRNRPGNTSQLARYSRSGCVQVVLWRGASKPFGGSGEKLEVAEHIGRSKRRLACDAVNHEMIGPFRDRRPGCRERRVR